MFGINRQLFKVNSGWFISTDLPLTETLVAVFTFWSLKPREQDEPANTCSYAHVYVYPVYMCIWLLVNIS